MYAKGKVTGHETRIFASTFIDNYVIASAGWDDTVLFWDSRTGSVVRSIFGPHVCGDAIVSVGGTLVTGSWRESEQLQIWDVGSGRCIKNISIGRPNNSLMIYSIALSSDRRIIAAGGSGMNSVMFYRRQDYSLYARTEKFDSCINCMDLVNLRFAVGFANSEIYVDNLLQK